MTVVNAGQSVAPGAIGSASVAPRSERPAAEITRIVLATFDPIFAAVCTGAFARATTPTHFVAASPPELLETARQLAPDLVVLDADGEDIAALSALAAKVMLVSDAHVVLVSAYLGPGSPGLGALLRSIASTFVQKPQGASSLGLADEEGPPFVAALLATLAANDDQDLAAETLDAGWDLEDEGAARGADDD